MKKEHISITKNGAVVYWAEEEIKGSVEQNLEAVSILRKLGLNVAYYGYCGLCDKDVYALRIGEGDIAYISREEWDILREVLN